MKRLAAFVLGLLVVGVAYGEKPDYLTKVKSLSSIRDKAFPSLQYNVPPDGVTRSPLDGKVASGITLPKDFGDALILEQTEDYELHGAKRQATYWVVLYNFTPSGAGLQTVRRNQPIGKATASGMKVAVYSANLDNFLLLMSGAFPIYYAERYWFFPTFMVSTSSTAYLSFRPIEDIGGALLVVAKDATESGPGYVYYPGYKVRFRTTLGAYPRELTSAEKDMLKGYERQYYGQSGLSRFGTDFSVEGLKFIFCWQQGFDKYLRDEYVLGKPLWIFGGIVTYDAFNGVGYVFVRDFSLKSVEEILEDRINALR